MVFPPKYKKCIIQIYLQTHKETLSGKIMPDMIFFHPDLGCTCKPLLSVSEFHRFMHRKTELADFTAGREFHPALKISVILIDYTTFDKLCNRVLTLYIFGSKIIECEVRIVDRANNCCFTGHRETKLPWGNNEEDLRCIALKESLYDAVEAVYRSGIRHFICGMATGCDFYFCEAVLALREEHPEVTLEAAIPFEGQSKGWSEGQRKRYDRLVSECDYHTVVQKDYSPDCYMRRNRYMADSCSVLIAAYNGRKGGTMNTLLYAIRNGLEVIQLPINE